MEVSLESIKQKVATYKPDRERLAVLRETPLLFLVGITAAGKDTLVQRLLAEYPAEYHRIITHTTRPPRQNHGVMERDGVEYHFIDLAASEQMLNAHDYIEANVFGDNVYGTTVGEIQAAHDEHKTAVGAIDVNGVGRFVQLTPTTKAVFVLPPSYEVWQERLQKRHDGKLDPEDFAKRLRIARAELKHALATDYFHFVINDNLDEAVSEVHSAAQTDAKDIKIQARARSAAEDLYRQLL